jgi:tetratricopeptide (TPR) repeat protein
MTRNLLFTWIGVQMLKSAMITIGVLCMIAVAIISTRTWLINRESPAATDSSSQFSPADIRIQAAEAMIRRSGTKPDGYNLLAAAFMQKARETADHTFNAKAEAALARSLEIDAGNYDALKLKAKLLLSNHRFSEALEVSRQAQSQRQDDHDVYGAITDANVELGNYDDAVKAAQTMVDLRPDTAAYSRIAYLRSLHGDAKGALQAMVVAVKAASPGDPEALAWCHVQLGNELMNTGKTDEAEKEYDHALLIFPDHRAALEAKAAARVKASDLDGAIAIYNRAQAKEVSADPALALGDLYTYLGRSAEAQKQYELFETLEAENVRIENSSRHLVSYWLDHNKNLAEALTLAQEERARRRDIFTCDMLAWALYRNGRMQDAKTAIDEALRLGTQNARISYHAGMIHQALGLKQSALKYLQEALSINPSFDLLQAKVAREALAR